MKPEQNKFQALEQTYISYSFINILIYDARELATYMIQRTSHLTKHISLRENQN
jgi:hypothetical protein